MALALLAAAVGVTSPLGNVDEASAISVDPIVLEMTGPASSTALIGEHVNFRFAMTNPASTGTRDVYNTTLRVVLPSGTSLVSTSHPITAAIANRPSFGYTTLILANLVDLELGSSAAVDLVVDTNPTSAAQGSATTPCPSAPCSSSKLASTPTPILR